MFSIITQTKEVKLPPRKTKTRGKLSSDKINGIMKPVKVPAGYKHRYRLARSPCGRMDAELPLTEQ